MGIEFDLSGSEKLAQINLLGQCWHNTPFGNAISREDGSTAIANEYLCRKLNIPEIAVDVVTIHDLVTPAEQTDQRLQRNHSEWFAEWFKWPRKLTLQAQTEKDPFQIFGYDARGLKREPHDCIITVTPIYARQHDQMIPLKKCDQKKTLLAFWTVVFLDDFRKF